MAAPVPAVAAPAPSCQQRAAPPPAVDASEDPAPGQRPPVPLTVPTPAIGGTRMAECGLVLPFGASQPPSNQFESWVLTDLDSGEVLAARDPHARQRPASLIKVLLAMVVLRTLKMDTVVVGTQQDADQDGTKVGIEPGGRYTNDQLLHALLMHSGNDAAHAFAMQLGGVDKAVAQMNTLARDAGALDTRAATPAGLDGPGMTSSAYDLALLFRLAMQDKQFADTVCDRQIDFPGANAKPGFVVGNDNPLLYSYEGDLGGKTGYTDDALHTYINAAQRGSRRIALVGMRGTMSPVTEMYVQAVPLMDYGFALARSGAQPVGRLVDQDRTSVASTTAAPPAQPGTIAAEGEQTVGLLAVSGVLAALAVLVLVGYGVLRRRTRSG
ncbi:MAG: D-alanyl-D-alanine carboxypeptidase [Kutzneria sp.]|nr:D-alanyl-D-alanine carboxypeptidase [Kutzneria sp.]